MSQKVWETLQALASLGSRDMADIGALPLLVVLGVSLASSMFISYLYVVFYKSRATGSEVHRAFPLIGVSITAIFVSVQFSLPLSLGLLGALSIVRFRTPIKEPEEIGFILLVIATSLSAATFNTMFLGIILFVAVVAMIVLRLAANLLEGRRRAGVCIIKLPKAECHEKLDEVRVFLNGILPDGRIDSVADSGETSTISYSFEKMNEEQLSSLMNDLQAVAAGSEAQVYINQSGGLF